MSLLDEIKGPVDLLLLSIPHTDQAGAIAPALGELVSAGTVRILDLVVVRKGDDGTVTAIELSELGPAAESYDNVEGEVTELLTEEDLDGASEMLEPGSAAVLLLFENSWAGKLAEAARGAGAEVIGFERIPREAIEESLAGVGD